ncbi:MAG: cation transporter dimerization domain-containing protein, partial [Lawsonibacter sp.]
FLSFPIDALAGLVVSALILKTGWRAARDTLDPLLGRPMDPELAADIDKLALGHDKILGIHDLVYHDYGPGRAMMSFHAEVPADADFLEVHDIIDHIERELKARHQIETVIHMDPVVRDERTAALQRQVADLARALDPCVTIHDFRLTPGPIHTNLIFDVVVPYGFRLSDSQVRAELGGQIKALSPRYYPVIQVDHSFVDRR